ncbi:hypothetical protein V8B97DRAFT_1881362, partial [Scleroderma yunnanense]
MVLQIGSASSMEISLDNIDRVLDDPSPEKLTQNLARVFSELLDPAQDVIFLFKYTDGIKARLEKRGITEAIGLDVFGKACLSAGIEKTMSELVKLHRPSTSHPKEIYITQYNALASLHHLFMAGTSDERSIIVNQHLSHGVVDALMQSLHHCLYTLQYLAADIIGSLTYSGKLQGRLTMTMTAEIMVGLCQLALEGSERLLKQLNSPALHWLWELPWKLPKPIDRDPFELAYHLEDFQELVMFCVCWLLRTDTPLTCKQCLELIKGKPEILDLLFDCAIIPRPRLIPTTLVCSMACETIVLIFRWPSHIVPGVLTPMDATLRGKDCKPLSQCLTILRSCKDWAEKIIDAWMQVEEEDYQEVQMMLEQMPSATRASSGDGAIAMVAENRGLKRIVILRLISTLTHAAESCGVINAEIETLLYIAYTASRRIPQKEECQTRIEQLCFVERSVGNDDLPMNNMFPQGPDTLFKTGNESVLGPIALARLLVVLAQRKALDTIQRLKKPRNGLSSCTSLHQVQQITHPAIIRRFLTIALERVMTCTQKGRDDYARGRYGFAQSSFTCSAELAAALIAFDIHTEGQYSDHVRGARKELVIALGNASEVALKQKRYLEAESFALGAISVGENVPTSEGLDPALSDKNQRRVRKARAFL